MLNAKGMVAGIAVVLGVGVWWAARDAREVDPDPPQANPTAPLVATVDTVEEPSSATLERSGPEVATRTAVALEPKRFELHVSDPSGVPLADAVVVLFSETEEPVLETTDAEGRLVASPRDRGTEVLVLPQTSPPHLTRIEPAIGTHRIELPPASASADAYGSTASRRGSRSNCGSTPGERVRHGAPAINVLEALETNERKGEPDDLANRCGGLLPGLRSGVRLGRRAGSGSPVRIRRSGHRLLGPPRAGRADGGTLVLDLFRLPTIRGRVVDANTGEPLPDARGHILVQTTDEKTHR